MFKRTTVSLLLALAIGGGATPAAIAAVGNTPVPTTAAQRGCPQDAAAAACVTPQASAKGVAIPKGVATVDCGCIGTTTIGVSHAALACANGSATTVTCGGQCPQGGEAWQLVCD